MTNDQLILFALLGLVFVFLVWGRWRYDLVAFVALLAALLTGIVPMERAFSGFGHPATVIIALVLIVSRGLSNSGAIELLARFVVDRAAASGRTSASWRPGGRTVGADEQCRGPGLLMPMDMQAAEKAGRSPSLSLMPMSFASILGGMITLIGTPPNIVIAEFRDERSASRTGCSTSRRWAGVRGGGFVRGPDRLAPVADVAPGARRGKALFDLADYIAEVSVPKGSSVIGKRVAELDERGRERRGDRRPDPARPAHAGSRAPDRDPGRRRAGAGSAAGSIEEFIGAAGLEYVRSGTSALDAEDLSLVEVGGAGIVPLAGRSARSVRLLYRYGVALVGVSREGSAFANECGSWNCAPATCCCCSARTNVLSDAITAWLPAAADRGQRVIQREQGLACGRYLRRAIAGRVRAHLPAGGPRLCRRPDGVDQHCAAARGLRLH